MEILAQSPQPLAEGRGLVFRLTSGCLVFQNTLPLWLSSPAPIHKHNVCVLSRGEFLQLSSSIYFLPCFLSPSAYISLPPHSLSRVQPHRLFSLSLVLSVSSKAVIHNSVRVLPSPSHTLFHTSPSHTLPLSQRRGFVCAATVAEMGHISFTLGC